MNTSIKLIILILFLVNPLMAVSQNKVVDSLQNELQKQIEVDTSTVDLLNAIAFKLWNKETDKALKLVEESNILADELKYKKGEAESLYIKGLIHIIRSNHKQAIDNFQNSLSISEILKDKKGMSKCLNATALVYFSKSDYKESLVFHRKALAINEEIGDQDNIATSLNNIAMIYARQGDYDNALVNYKRSFQIKKGLNKKRDMAIALNNIGTIYMDFGDFPNALEYFNKSLIIREQRSDTLSMASTLNNIGNVYKNQEKYERALEYYGRSLEIYTEYDRQELVAKILTNIGTIHELQSRYKEADTTYKEALKISESLNDKDQVAIISSNIGNLQMTLKNYAAALQNNERTLSIGKELGAQRTICMAHLGLGKVYYRQKEYRKALFNALESEKIASEIKLSGYQNRSYLLLSKICYDSKDYKNAYEYHLKHKDISDSIFNKKSIQKLTQLEYEHAYRDKLDSANKRELKLTRKVKAVDRNLAKSQKQKLMAIIGFLALTMFLVIIILSLRIRNVKSINQNILIEQKLLRSQMNPHFIFNSLSVLQGIILNKEYQKSIVYISKFSKLFRMVLENSRDKIVPLKRELMAIENYLVIQNLGTSYPYNYTITVAEEVDKKEVLIPPMMIQPFVENAIEHGFQSKKEDRQISIDIHFCERQLICEIKDNGIGIDSYLNQKSDQRKSLATTITSERLKMMSKEFKVQTGIDVKDRISFNEEGTVVILTLPYKITYVD